MYDNIKVSVIVPFYNVEKYLRECLEHLAHQTLKDIEVILINDGSTDCSGQIALEFAKKYKNFILFEQNNQGQSAARNRGIEESRGDYIYFCDSDDCLNVMALEFLWNYAQKKKLNILHFELAYFQEGEKLEELHFHDIDVEASRLKGYYNVVMSGKECLSIMLRTDVHPSPVVMLIQRELLNHVKFFPGIIHEDVLFLFRLYMKAERMENIPRCLYYARVRSNSTMTTVQYARRFWGFGIGFCETSADLLNDQESVKSYPGLLRMPLFLFSQAIDQYKYLSWEERREAAGLMREMKNFARKMSYCNSRRIKRFCVYPQFLILTVMRVHQLLKTKNNR